MKRIYLLGWIFIAGIFNPVHASLWSFLNPTEPDIIVNGDVFDRNTPTPAPGNPVY